MTAEECDSWLNSRLALKANPLQTTNIIIVDKKKGAIDTYITPRTHIHTHTLQSGIVKVDLIEKGLMDLLHIFITSACLFTKKKVLLFVLYFLQLYIFLEKVVLRLTKKKVGETIKSRHSQEP